MYQLNNITLSICLIFGAICPSLQSAETAKLEEIKSQLISESLNSETRVSTVSSIDESGGLKQYSRFYSARQFYPNRYFTGAFAETASMASTTTATAAPTAPTSSAPGCPSAAAAGPSRTASTASTTTATAARTAPTTSAAACPSVAAAACPSRSARAVGTTTATGWWTATTPPAHAPSPAAARHSPATTAPLSIASRIYRRPIRRRPPPASPATSWTC